MNVKWIIGRKTFTVLAVILAFVAIRELLVGSLVMAGFALALAAYNVRDAQNNVEVTAFELDIRKGAK